MDVSTAVAINSNSGVTPITVINVDESMTQPLCATPCAEPCANTAIAPVSNTSYLRGILSTFIERIKMPEVIIIYTISIVLLLVFLLSYLFGIYSEWYLSLVQPEPEVWLPRIAWIGAGIMSYLGIYILWSDSNKYNLDFYLSISVLFFIGTFLMIAWSVAYLQLQRIDYAVWIAGIMFIYQLGIFVYIWHLKPIAAALMIPIVGMYLYLLYTMIRLAELNGVVL